MKFIRLLSIQLFCTAVYLGGVATELATAQGDADAENPADHHSLNNSKEKVAVSVATTRGKGKVTTTTTEDGIALSIHCSVGIGEATVTRSKATWPKEIVLKVYLRGLESLEIVNGNETLRTSISSSGSHDQRMSLIRKGKTETPLREDHPLWTDIFFHAAAGKVTAKPASDGYYQLIIPVATLANNPNSLTIRWIDFYR